VTRGPLRRSRGRVERWIRFPRRVLRVIRLLFSVGARRRLVVAVLGSFMVMLLEMLGVAAMLPLLQILTDSPTDEGFLGWVSSRLGEPTKRELAMVMGSVVFGAFLLKGFVALAFNWWQNGFILQEQANTSVRLLQRYLSAPYWLHLQRNTASLLRAMNEAVTQTYGLVTHSIMAVTDVALMAGVITVLVVVTPGPAAVAILYFGVTAFAFQRWARQRSTRAGERLMGASLKSYQAALQALGGVKEIKVRRKANHFLATYRVAREEMIWPQRTAAFIGQLPRYMFEILFTFGVALMVFAVFLVSDSGEGISLLGLFVAAGVRLMPSMTRLLSSLNAIRYFRRGLSIVVADLTDLRAEESLQDQQVLALDIHSEIRVDGLSFQYHGTDATVLHGVSFDVPAGSSFAVVGGSGGGKSTLVDLILGLHEPTHGRICVDGTDIARQLPQWQRTIGMVPQDVYLLDDTLRANIAFGEGDHDVDPERIGEVVELAQLHDVVAELPEGLDTVIGERGVRLSGGQRQRIGIARALYLRPKLLVLDEATSALDNETEQRITETITRLHGRMTMIIVAHRLSTVRHCDRLLFLHQGAVEAVGTFDEVRARSPRFARLVELGSLFRGDAPLAGTLETASESPD
jgi:ATP-binding cassette, subfamily B, bacterial PglK